MKKFICAALMMLTLSGCGGATAAAPAVTETVTVPGPTVTVTVTAAPAPTPAPSTSPAKAATSTTPAKPATAVIPSDIVGMNAEALDDDLKALGFTKVVYNSDTGKTVLLLSNWTVTGIDNPGTTQSTDRAVVVHVTK
ncbi:hypothetical protein [Sinomonas sp. B1-1]|uniref:hypothetical protein n=1 Tax=Sinomonas sp. B1-1 TaxID=3141454 RepID=UPI003D29E242